MAYDGGSDFGGGWAGDFGQADVQEYMQVYRQIQKSLEAGYPEPTYAGGGSGGALMTQSIEGTLKWATFKQDHLRFWPKFPKSDQKLSNTVHEYTRQTDLGARVDLWAAEGAVGPEIDSNFERLLAKVKYVSLKKRVSHPITLLSNMIGGAALDKANKDASLYIKEFMDRQLFFGDSTMNAAAFDGLKRTCEATHTAANPKVHDLRGAALDSSRMRDESVRLVNPPNYGNPGVVWMSFETLEDQGKLMGTYLRYDMADVVARNAVGDRRTTLQATGFNGPYGPVNFEASIQLGSRGAPAATAIGEVQPAQPNPSLATADDAATLFVAADYGVYQYQFVAVGAKGKSLHSVSDAATIDATHRKVTATIAAPGTDNVLYYEVFRSKVGETGVWKIADVVQARAGGVPDTTTFVDMNENLPDTAFAFMLEMSSEVMEWKQLLDFARVPLARTDLYFPFTYIIYGTPIFYLPLKMCMFKNVGRAS